MTIAPLHKYHNQQGAKPKLYPFDYSCQLKLKSGRKFKKIGTVLALHERQAKELIKEKYDCYDIKVNPNLKNGAFASDIAFGKISGSGTRYRDRVN